MRAVLFAALLLASCAQAGGAPAAPTSSAALPEEYSANLSRLDQELRMPGIVAVGIGETADLGDGLRVRPIEVVQDSRCPANVDCVWAGVLRVRVAVAGDGERVIALREPATASRGAFVLEVVSPSRWSPQPEPGRPYRFGFRRV
ncbi:MAG: hypothetical protein JNM59_12900 [Hyphomonadaceae bacterium]|nr:hypothetical protein [Hyphomonadaceae bacterium]